MGLRKNVSSEGSILVSQELEVEVNLGKHSSVSKYQNVFTQRVKEMVHYFDQNPVDLAEL